MISTRFVLSFFITGAVFASSQLCGGVACGQVPHPSGPTSSGDTTEGKGTTPMAQKSAWTWGYFFAADDAKAIQALARGHKSSLTYYQVERVNAVRGKPGVALAKGARLIRMEMASRLSPERAKTQGLLLVGLPQHLQYTTGEQREELNKKSRPELPPGKDTVAVIIPIRKKAAWWAMPVDERMAYFQKKGDKIGHTAIGAKYADRIYRKLYHTRYAVETADHDFITYFEFERKHTEDFQSLLKQLRDPQQNPEWEFVDREYEIWTIKSR
jgi:hypothetical protein